MRALDDTDLRILKSLQNDPRMPVSRIARAVGLTDNAVRYRMRRMQSAGIIRGFVMVVDPRLLGRPQLSVVTARMHDLQELPDLLHRTPEVAGAYVGAGDFNVCLLVCTRDAEELERLVAGIRGRPDVEDARALRVQDAYRASPMPLTPEPFGLERDQARGVPPAVTPGRKPPPADAP